MNYKFTPKSDSELDALMNNELINPGQYTFKIISIEEKITPKMYDMLVLKLSITTGNETRTIKDNIVMIDFMAWKFKHFCQSIGMQSYYEKGELPLKLCEGLSGILKLGVEKGKPKNDGSGENYLDKNIVLDYIKSETPKEINDIFNDDVNF